MLGQRLGHFEIVSLLGEGGMGAVYKARDTHLERLAALKVLPPDKMADTERKRRFSQEAKAASALNHPNIITIYDIAADSGVDYIAMEFVEGRTLEAMLASGPLRITDVVKYARQMADGLAAAHAAGILHRDLKPANVMVREDGIVKLLDFGLAKLTDMSDTGEMDATRTLALTRVGTVMGTMAYMSPEQAEGRKLDFRSDIFSYGVVLYEMVSGKRAFPGHSQASVIASLLRDEPKPVAELRPDTPLELQQLIARCLRKDPALRVQSMADARAALDDLTEISRSTVSAAVRIPPPPPPLPPPPPTRVQTRAEERAERRAERKKKKSSRYWWLILVAIVLGPNLLRQFRSDSGPEPGGRHARRSEAVALTAEPLTMDAGVAREPSFSPDATQVAYCWNGAAPTGSHIYIKPIDNGAVRQLTTGANEDFAPAWSPDGNTIAFLRRRKDVDQILLIASAGGAARKTQEIAHRDGNSLAWTKDSHKLIFPDSPPEGGPVALYELTLATGAKRRIVKPGDESKDLWPAISPDGDNIAFVRQTGDGQSEVYTAEMPDSDEADANPRQITSLGALCARPAWTEDGDQLIFAVRSDNAWNLWRVPSDGDKSAQQLTGAGTSGEDPAVSSRGGHLVYSRKDGDSHTLWLVQRFR